ncbi:LacI family transcriptional regulator [Oscillospiraceae bacterium]|nr:LacI family transcriptional regulator [Oscillospiraceae bacterium]BDF76415.1 LacI family transcriptional regulator [Oscillospiraceae bacterium]
MSIRKIAAMTGLSISTVSNVLNDTRVTSEESKQKVLEAAGKIGYRPNLAARMLRTQRSNTVALIIPTDEANRNANFFYMDMLLGIHKKLRETDYNVIVATYGGTSGGERSLSAVEVCKKQWVDGVIFVPSSKNARQLDVLREMEIPFVLADRKVDGGGYSFVGSDNEGGAFDAVSRLIGSGRRRVGFVGGALSVSSGSERFEGYRNALEAAGLAYDEGLAAMAEHFSVEDGEACVRRLLEQKADAIFVADNVLTMGAMRELNRQGVAIPGQTAIIGYDYFDWMGFLSPPVTSVRQRSHQMGYVAAEMLMRKLSGMEGNERIILETELVLGGSHG